MTSRNWSTYQQAIFAAVESTTRNLAINAVAGSGKTTTLVEAANRLPRNKRVVFLAFNKHIVNELSARMNGVECMTIHSLGMKACAAGFSRGRVKVDEHKTHDIVDDLLAGLHSVPPVAHGAFAKTVRQLVDFGRLTLTAMTDYDAVDAMIDHFGITEDLISVCQENDLHFPSLVEEAITVAGDAIKRGVRAYERTGAIDFTDMLYLPARLNLPVRTFDVLLIDEAQDLNAAQLSLVLRAAGNGRVISVGDPRQAIQGFAGADDKAFDNVVARTQAEVLPLSVCYRCPTAHIVLAKEIVPGIEAAPDAAEGTVETVDMQRFEQMPRTGDLVLCRMNAPLIGAALRLIAKGIQARVRGRNIAQGLVKMIDDAAKITIDPTIDAQGWRTGFMKRLDILVAIRMEMLQAKKHTETAQETLLDQQACVVTFLEGSPTIADANTLKTSLQGLFSDENATVWLSSIHRSKGLEADRVFVLRPEKMALNGRNMLPWQLEQEQNLKYVGLTRAKKSLFFVTDPKATDAKTADAPVAVQA